MRVKNAVRAGRKRKKDPKNAFGATERITVRTNNGLASIKAYVFGPLAVHRTVGDEGWTVTHVRTGYAVAKRVSCREIAYRLTSRLLPLRWDIVGLQNICDVLGPDIEKIKKEFVG